MAGSEHAKCVIEGCTKIRVKEQMCTAHYNEKHGIVKKRGPISGKKRKYTKRKKTKRTYKKRAIKPDEEPEVLSEQIADKATGLIKIRDSILDSIQIIKGEFKKIEAMI